MQSRHKLLPAVGLLMLGCRPTATFSASPPPQTSKPAFEAPTTNEPAAPIGPDDPRDPRVVFEWIDAHITELHDERSFRRTVHTVFELDDEQRRVEIADDGEALLYIGAQTSCSEYQEPYEAVWRESWGDIKRTYYLFDGEVIAVIEEKSTGWSSNEIGECIDFESTEVFYMWKGRLLAHWTKQNHINCYCSDDAERNEDRCEVYESDQPEPTSLRFSDDPVVQRLAAELDELASDYTRGPYLECEPSSG